jgi:hypothetical protein
MAEERYKPHHAGNTPEERIASRLRNSGDEKNADHHAVHGSGSGIVVAGNSSDAHVSVVPEIADLIAPHSAVRPGCAGQKGDGNDDTL